MQHIVVPRSCLYVCVYMINPLSTKLYLSDLKTQFVPRSKHSLLRF